MPDGRIFNENVEDDTMHHLAYFCLPIKRFPTSFHARRRVYNWLKRGRYDILGVVPDFWCIGGRFSGYLTWHRLEYQNEKIFEQCQNKLKDARTLKGAVKILGRHYPNYHGLSLFDRDMYLKLGYEDDAQIIDEVLFNKLKHKFIEPEELGGYDKIITVNCKAPASPDEAINYWIVVVDYHS